MMLLFLMMDWLKCRIICRKLNFVFDGLFFLTIISPWVFQRYVDDWSEETGIRLLPSLCFFIENCFKLGLLLEVVSFERTGNRVLSLAYVMKIVVYICLRSDYFSNFWSYRDRVKDSISDFFPLRDSLLVLILLN